MSLIEIKIHSGQSIPRPRSILVCAINIGVRVGLVLITLYIFNLPGNKENFSTAVDDGLYLRVSLLNCYNAGNTW